ncbi:MAG: DUF2336 domain-containing protein, partial [Hyphomonadaceae bacterium]
MTIATMRATLTQDDVRRLIRGETPEERAASVQKICRRIDTLTLSDADRAVASQILGVIANDAAVMVRKALAETLKNSPNLPPEIARKLAADADAVALPVLKHSPVLTDEDLVEIVLAGSAAKQVAIAGRPEISAGLTEVISNYACREAVETVAANEGAVFSDDAYAGVLKRFGGDEGVASALVMRRTLPPH